MRGIIAALLLGGCATVGTVQTARPVERGTTQVGIEPGLFGVEDRGWYPAANVSVRHGFGNRFDLGARVGTSGLGLSAKVLLTDPYDPDLAVSIAPSGGGFALGALGVGTKSIHGQLPLLVGIRVGREHELVLGPKITAWSLSASAGAAGTKSLVVGAGGSVGLSLKVAPGVRLLPEVAMVQPVFGSGQAKLLFWQMDVGAGGAIYQGTVGILLGGERSSSAPVAPYSSDPYRR